jgi:Tfp pilus assembly protein PilO
LKTFSWKDIGRLSHRRFLWGVAAVLILVCGYTFGVVPLVEAKKKADEEIAVKQRILLKYVEVLGNRKVIEEALERTQKQNEEIQKKLLPGETAQLGAANLQEVVKRLSDKNGINLRSFRFLEPKETGLYRKISMQIELNPMNSMMRLAQFLHDLEHQDKELTISEMDLLVFNPRLPNNIQGNLVISGFMKGGKGKEKGRE